LLKSNKKDKYLHKKKATFIIISISYLLINLTIKLLLAKENEEKRNDKIIITCDNPEY